MLSRSVQWSAVRESALSGLESRVLLVDDVPLPLADHDLAVLRPALDAALNLHGVCILASVLADDSHAALNLNLVKRGIRILRWVVFLRPGPLLSSRAHRALDGASDLDR